jgi:hypothetical protein
LFSGRESDYGRVAREFEAMVDQIILQAVRDAASNPEESSSKIEAVANEKGSTKALLVPDIDRTPMMVSKDAHPVTGVSVSSNHIASTSNVGVPALSTPNTVPTVMRNETRIEDPSIAEEKAPGDLSRS